MRSHPANRFSKSSPCGFIPAKTILARALMPRQPYSAAVQSDRRSGYIPNPYGRDLGLGYRVRTLPQGRDRWGINSTE